ncbi:MAG: hypothetical protein N3A71_02825 [Candidatus Dojkabacteria bacterium]|nr:hypothetical protein [Candidatus Dojkabacteria bacterium]
MENIKNIFAAIPGGDIVSISILYFLGSSIFAFLISPLIIHILYKLNIRRKSKGDIIGKKDETQNKVGTPIMGGLIVVITVVVITFIFNWERSMTYIPIGAFLLAACLGGIDDILNIFGNIRNKPRSIKVHINLIKHHANKTKRFYYLLTLPIAIIKRFLFLLGSKPNSGLHVYEKIFIQTIIGLVVGSWIYFVNKWDFIWLPYILNIDIIRNTLDLIPGIKVNQFGDAYTSISVGWLIIPFVTLVIITISNAVNFADGMDGLASGLLIQNFIGLGIIAFSLAVYNTELYEFRHLSYLAFTVAGALVAYQYFNIKPARIQLGDIGSLALGTLLAVMAIVMKREFALFFIAFVILFDGILSRIINTIYRIFKGRRLFYVIPFHYHLEFMGWSEEKVVMRMWTINMIFVAFGVWLAGI